MKDKILKLIYGLFFAAVIAIVLLLAASRLPLPGNYKVLIVQSGSMEPAIHTGAIVVVKPEARYKIGDVITFTPGARGTESVTHRIVEIRQEGAKTSYITKGDANDSVDMKEINKTQVMGKVLFNVPFAGYAVAAAKKPFGFILIIVVPALLVIYDEGVKIFKEMKAISRKKKKKENIKKIDENSETKQ